MKTWDVAVIGGGIIGVSVAIALRKCGASVLIVERGEPGREASHAAAGMIASFDPHTPAALRPLATASAKLYSEFVHELEDESGIRVDYRCEGTLLFEPITHAISDARAIDPREVSVLEPRLKPAAAVFLPEASVDPPQLFAAALNAAKHRNIDISSGAEAIGLELECDRAVAVRTVKTRFAANLFVNCAGAWAQQIGPLKIPTKPVKGQMLAVVNPAAAMPHEPVLRHVVRSPEVYLVPRSDGRIVIGATVEDAGYDKRIDTEVIRGLRDAAARILPDVSKMRLLESWAGLRPGTPDGLPILGTTSLPNYFVATGHYRDGILLAPVTAQIMSNVVRGLPSAIDISAFALSRFA